MQATDRHPAQRLSLRTQIGLALGVLSLYLILSGAITLAALQTVRSNLNGDLGPEIERSYLAADLTLATLQARRFEKDLFLNSDDPAARSDYRAKWDAAYGAIMVALDGLEALAEDDAEREEVVAWRGLAAGYRAAMNDIAAQLDRGGVSPGEANALLSPSKELIRQLTDESLALMERESAEVREAKGQIGALTDSLAVVLLGLGAAGVLAAVLTTFIVPRQLAAPLRRLQTAVGELSAGNLEARVVVGGSTEVAQLAVGFNQMADTIQRQIRELDQSAVVEEQNRQLQELIKLVRRLENPVIALYRDVLLVPLVGHIDERRADQLRGETLNAIHERRASIVLVDITGIVEMNAQVAAHLQLLAAGARLLGARVILTGVRAETARALVDLGLSEIFETMGQLQDGVTYVMRRDQHSLN